MLLRLLLLRLSPLACLYRCKDRKTMKIVFVVIIAIYFLGFIISAATLFAREQWKGIISLFAALFPQYLCYIFAGWLIARCVWSAWSERVFRRIGRIAFAAVIAGIFAENYWNPEILQFFCNFFK